MLNLKKLLTKILAFQVKSVHVAQQATFSSGQGSVAVSYTLPAGAEIMSITIRRFTNPDWIYLGIVDYNASTASISYNNTFSSAISGSVELDILYR